MEKEKKNAVYFILMIALLLSTSYYIGYSDGEDTGRFEQCKEIGGSLYQVNNQGIICLNSSLMGEQNLLVLPGGNPNGN